MKTFEILPHPSDLKIRAFGQNREEVFSNMASGMFEAVKDENLIVKEDPVIQDFQLNSPDLAALLVDFLNQLVFLSDTSNEIYDNFELGIMQVSNENWSLKCRTTGYKIRGLKLEIKAVTYNELKIAEEKGKWVAEVVFDI